MGFVEVSKLKKYFPVQKSFIAQLFSRKAEYVRAVDGIDLTIEKGDIYGLVGESGSGKTTTGRLTAALVQPTAGEVSIDGVSLFSIKKDQLRKFRRRVQFIYQDPMSSLNPKMTVGDAVAEPLRYLGEGPRESLRQTVSALLERVGLSPAESFFDRYPQELSGGQRQRVVIARALVVKPDYVVADEPVAMVDVSVRAQIMDLLLEMQKELGLTVLLITHDLAVAKHMCNRISVMYLGNIAETGSNEQIFANPLHPYTKALMAAVPVPNPRARTEKKIPVGEIPSALYPPPGCRFHPRCPYVFERCRVEVPELIEREPGHYVACHLYD
ncbi:MAG: ABC transporter ATP-binding protein [Nitrososphaerales archaeon]|nr:ABC transporter ATP-binding protein [Nitrososphaerales archaeon]